MTPRYANASWWDPSVARTLDTFRDRKEASLLQANNLLLPDDARARASAETGVYAYAELRLRTTGERSDALLEEVRALRIAASARAEQLRAAGSQDPSPAAAEAAYLEVESLLSPACEPGVAVTRPAPADDLAD